MAEGREKYVYEQVVKAIRDDLDYLRKAYSILISRAGDRLELPDSETRRWIMDVFVDKIYEIETKVIKLFDETNLAYYARNLNTISSASTISESLNEYAFEYDDSKIEDHLLSINKNLNDYIKWVEFDISEVRRRLIRSGWTGLKTIEPTKYVSLERKKYVSAREELAKAKNNVDKGFDDVMIYLRNAIDYSLKEKYGFTRIFPMKEFFKAAAAANFPLPSYDLIYYLYNEASDRIHNGKVHTIFELEQAIRMVDSFIDNLELIEVTETQISDFTDKYKSIVS